MAMKLSVVEELNIKTIILEAIVEYNKKGYEYVDVISYKALTDIKKIVEKNEG